jgi:hypothetical protein
MSNVKTKNLQKKRDALLAELSSLSGLLHGSWLERYSVCSRSNCKCHSGERHGPRRYLIVNEQGRQRQKYIPNACVEQALKGIEQYRRLQNIIMRITEINLTLLKENKSHESSSKH